MQQKMEIILQLIWQIIVLYPIQVQIQVPVPEEAHQLLTQVPVHLVPVPEEALQVEVPAIQEDQAILEDQAIAEGLQVEGLQVVVPTIVVDHPEEAHPVEILDQAVAPVMDQVL